MVHRPPKLGDVLQFPLPDGTFAYGRKLRDAAVAFYAETSSEPNRPPIGSADFQFVVPVYSDVLRSDEVPIVGFDPTPFNGDDWPPPGVVIDLLTGSKKIYERGEMRPSEGDEWIGLERVAVWPMHNLVDRLMGFGDAIMDRFPAGPPPSG